jgi:hypothetical protein
MGVEDYQVQTLWSLFDIQPPTGRRSGIDRGTELCLRVRDEQVREQALELLKQCSPVHIVEAGWNADSAP